MDANTFRPRLFEAVSGAAAMGAVRWGNGNQVEGLLKTVTMTSFTLLNTRAGRHDNRKSVFRSPTLRTPPSRYAAKRSRSSSLLRSPGSSSQALVRDHLRVLTPECC